MDLCGTPVGCSEAVAPLQDRDTYSISCLEDWLLTAHV